MTGDCQDGDIKNQSFASIHGCDTSSKEKEVPAIDTASSFDAKTRLGRTQTEEMVVFIQVGSQLAPRTFTSKRAQGQ